MKASASRMLLALVVAGTVVATLSALPGCGTDPARAAAGGTTSATSSGGTGSTATTTTTSGVTGGAPEGGARLPKGSPCTVGAECETAFCVDGVRRDGACDSPCQACAAPLTGSANGKCSNATDGTVDPRGVCAAATPTSCGTDGVCRNGACEDWPAGTVCAAASCVSGAQTSQAVCNGSGTCTSGATISRVPYICGPAACKTSCLSDADCAQDAYCLGSHCVGQSPTGSACNSADQCTSGFCVDGFCCDKACASACEACAAVLSGGADGTCSQAVDGSVDPRGLCPAMPASTCGSDGMCKGGGCEDWPAGTPCAASSHATAACNAGACVATWCDPGYTDCAPDGCVDLTSDGTHCGTCANACGPPGEGCCLMGACISTRTEGWETCHGSCCDTNLGVDRNNCGACGHVCSFPQASAACAGGACYLVACNAGWADCDNDPWDLDGCETNIASDTKNCGSCGKACAAGKNCVNGGCQ